MLHSLPSDVALQAAPGVFATPLGRLLFLLVAIAVVVLIGKILLGLAWRILTIAIVVLGLLYLFSLL